MQFDPKALAKLLEKPDAELWAAVRQIAAASGVSLPAGVPPPGDIQKLRGILAGAPGKDYGEALRILNSYRQKGGGGKNG